MVEPDKIVKKYYRNENGRNVATDTDDINYDNIYLRLSLLGVQPVANGENFRKFYMEYDGDVDGAKDKNRSFLSVSWERT